MTTLPQPPPEPEEPTPSTARIGPAAPPDYAPDYPPAYPPAYARTVIPPAPVSSARSTNRLAVLSLVMAFVFAPAGIVLGYMAKRQIRRTGDEGDGLATAGLIAGYAISGVILASCCGLIVFELMDTAGVLGTPRRP